MKHKTKILFLQILMIITLISYGFASWEITSGGTSISNELIADSIVDSTKIIQVDKSVENTDNGIKTIKYYDNGFMNSDGTISLSTTIEVNYYLNITNCKNQFNISEYSGISIQIELGYSSGVTSSYNIFESNANQTFGYYTNLSPATSSGNAVNNSYIVNLVYDHSSTLEEFVHFKMIYNIVINNQTQYATLFNAFENDNIEFSVTAKVDGYVGGNS